MTARPRYAKTVGQRCCFMSPFLTCPPHDRNGEKDSSNAWMRPSSQAERAAEALLPPPRVKYRLQRAGQARERFARHASEEERRSRSSGVTTSDAWSREAATEPQGPRE